MALMLCTAIYWSGLYGGWLFDDYPNIVDNQHLQIKNLSLPSLTDAALSSPSSELKRPLASLSFALNYLASGLEPFQWKLANLLIHLVNGLLVFVLMRILLRTWPGSIEDLPKEWRYPTNKADMVAATIAAGWLLLPINLTAVLYVVQRMESLANVFVLLGLLGYVHARRRMQVRQRPQDFLLGAASATLPAAVGVLAKETAVLLPLYALAVEWSVFRFRSYSSHELHATEANPSTKTVDKRLLYLFGLILVAPAVLGLYWLLPSVLNPTSWTTRDFDLRTRLLSETRIVLDYVWWTLLPSPHALSFYHDNFHISEGWLSPWTTATSAILLAGLASLALWLHRRRPFASLGILFFLGCHLLTGTILPLELIYEHRNYFASIGLVMALVTTVAPVDSSTARSLNQLTYLSFFEKWLRPAFLFGLILFWGCMTATTAFDWGDDLRLAKTLAERAPRSPRAQYELGRTYIIKSHYDPTSTYTQLAYAPLERAAALPESSILPQQALIFMNANMRLPLKDAWWDSMISKLKARPPGVQDESSLAALTTCARNLRCDLPKAQMKDAFEAAISHRHPSPRMLATYGDYAWNVLDDHALGMAMTKLSVTSAPDEPAYRITLARMAIANKQVPLAQEQISALQRLDIGGRLDEAIKSLQELMRQAPTSGRTDA